MSPAAFRMPESWGGARGVLEQLPDGTWVQRDARPDEDLEAMTRIGEEAWGAMLQDPALLGPPNPSDPALRRVRARPGAPSPTQPGFESMLAYAPGGSAAAQEGPQAARGAAIAPGPMGNAVRAMTDGVKGAALDSRAAMPEAIAQLLERARQDSRSRRLAAAIGRSGALVGSGIARAGGGRGEIDEAGYEALAREAERPVAEAQQRLAEMTAAQQRARQRVLEGREDETYAAQTAAMRSEADPTSPESQSARAIFTQMLPTAAQQPGFERLSAAQLKKQFPFAKEILDARAREMAARSAASDRALQREMMQEQRRERQFETDVQKLGKETQGFAELESDLRRMESLANTPGDIAGVGFFASRLPDWLLSTDGIQNRQATLRVVVQGLREASGVAVTPQEAERYMIAHGWGFGAPEESWRAGVRAFLRDTRRAIEAKQAKYRPEVSETLKARGGFTADRFGAMGAPEAPAPAAAGARRAVRDKSGRLLGYIYPDGREELIGG